MPALVFVIAGFSVSTFFAYTSSTLDSHIKNLRKKIGAILPGEEVISSVYGIGYKLNVKS